MQRGSHGGAGEDASASEAFQFSFFGDLGAVDGDLGEALEEGLDAPPEEEALIDGLEEEAVEDDLSYASMFANLLGKGDGVMEDTDDDPLSGLLADQPDERLYVDEQTSNVFSTGSIALGGLLTASLPEEQPVNFGVSRGILDMPFPKPPPSHQAPSGGILGGTPGKVLTAHDLEAQLRANGGIQQNAPPIISPQGGQQRGVFTPDMIMQQQQQYQQQYGPTSHSQMTSRPVVMQPGMPLTPPMPSQVLQPPPAPRPWQSQPAPPRPPMHLDQESRVAHHPPHQGVTSNNLAQRLKALNLADKTSPVKKPPPRRMHSSRCMSREEIDNILFMQSKALHMAPPYLEDYYYQAFLDKYYDKKNKETFAPESVRELAPTEKVAAESVSFVKLDGLGRVAFSNIRRPRPLMDLSVDASQNGTELSDSEKPQMKRLDQEPALAARIMIEDCMALVLDVQDVDRIFVASGGVEIENESALKQRRMLLVEGLASSLRISENPEGDSDGVFLRLMSRNKGRVLATRALRIVYPPEEMKNVNPNYRILWALLRQIATIFRTSGIKETDSETINTLAALAKGMMDIISKISSPHALGDALVAISSGKIFSDANEPSFFAPGQYAADINRKPWLCDVIGALFSRGSELDLDNTVSDTDHVNSWSSSIESIFKQLQSYLTSCKSFLATVENDGVASRLRKNIPVPLIGQLLMAHFTKKQKETIQNLLLDIGV